MNTLIPGAPLRSLSPTTNEYQRAQGESRAAKPARVARFTLDAPEHSGTIPGARGDILTPGVALTSNLAVIFTLNQHRFHSYSVLDEPEASDIVNAAIEELQRGEGQSQFLFVHLYDPHWPYLPPRELLEKFGPRPKDISDLMERTQGQEAPKNASEVEDIIRLYDSEIAFADRELGRFFQALKDNGMYDDTLVIITSDHGEAFYEHGHWQHNTYLKRGARSQTLGYEIRSGGLRTAWLQVPSG